MPDEYAVDAISALRGFVRARPAYQPMQQFLGGKSNRVLTGTWDGQPVVFKYYGEADGGHIGAPADRQRRELLALRLHAASGLVPEIIEADPYSGITVLRRHRGRCLNWDRRAHWPTVGRSFGALWARLLARPLDHQDLVTYTRLACDGLDVPDTVCAVLDRSDWILRRTAPHHRLLRASLDRCRAHVAALSSGPTTLVRLDNNPGNLLQVEGTVGCIIDWEQVWVGTPLLQLGILKDLQLAFLPGVLDGYAQVTPLPESTLIDVAAELSAWWRVLWNFHAWRSEHGPDPRRALGGPWLRKVQDRLLRHDGGAIVRS